MKTKDISDFEIEEARKVLRDHTVDPLNREGAFESLLYCIASQALPWERASDFVYALRNGSGGKYASWNRSTNSLFVNQIAEEMNLRFSRDKRFDPSIDYFKNKEGEWWEGIRDADSETRKFYFDALKWVGYKTFSFWHLCLGGTNLMALDVHVLRGLSELEVLMDKFYYVPKPRMKGEQEVRRTPSKGEYIRIENDARKIFSEDERFLIEGEVNMALVDSLLWWRGAKRGKSGQLSLFGRDTGHLPYAPKDIES